jgi:hypothetical protein
MFNQPGIIYLDRPMFHGPWELPDYVVQQIKQHNLAIIDLSSEHWGADGFETAYKKFERLGINFLLLSHDPSDHLKFPRMLFYPHWYHWSKKNFIVSRNNSVDRTYKWSCLNGNPRNHRIYNYFYSQQQSYFSDACFTFHNADVHRADDVVLSNKVSSFWRSVRNNIPHRNEVLGQGPRPDARCDLPSNADSYVHLVTETTVVPKVFVSEKTWKPIASGQLFLIFGNPGTVSYLREQGVDVFDDIIDHSYDSNLDWESRLHQIHQQLEKLIGQDLKNLYINTQQRRQSNIEKFFSGAFDQKYQLTIEQCINTPS